MSIGDMHITKNKNFLQGAKNEIVITAVAPSRAQGSFTLVHERVTTKWFLRVQEAKSRDR